MLTWNSWCWHKFILELLVDWPEVGISSFMNSWCCHVFVLELLMLAECRFGTPDTDISSFWNSWCWHKFVGSSWCWHTFVLELLMLAQFRFEISYVGTSSLWNSWCWHKVVLKFLMLAQVLHDDRLPPARLSHQPGPESSSLPLAPPPPPTHTHTHNSSSGSGSIGYQHLYCYYYRHNDYIMSSSFMTCRKVLPLLVIYRGTCSVAITRIASIKPRTVDRWTWHDSSPALPQWRLTCLGRPPD